MAVSSGGDFVRPADVEVYAAGSLHARHTHQAGQRAATQPTSEGSCSTWMMGAAGALLPGGASACADSGAKGQGAAVTAAGKQQAGAGAGGTTSAGGRWARGILFGLALAAVVYASLTILTQPAKLSLLLAEMREHPTTFAPLFFLFNVLAVAMACP